jgi:GNAT superfamily N-acetyltransferase
MSDFTLDRLTLPDMDAAARVMRTAFDERLPWLAALHTPDEDRGYFRDLLFVRCQIWGAIAPRGLVGIIAFRKDWIDQLYILPESQTRGAGGALLDIAKSTFDYLQLWTFQKNAGARRFYERRGFLKVEETDGSRNEEREPDVRYEWRRRSG